VHFDFVVGDAVSGATAVARGTDGNTLFFHLRAGPNEFEFRVRRHCTVFGRGFAWEVGGGRRFARAKVLGVYEGSREKTARKERRFAQFIMSELKLRPPKKRRRG
jgi:hypothetical protein